LSWTAKHLAWIHDTNQRLKTFDGKDVTVLELRHLKDDETLSAWATHFRNHYCLDTEINALANGTGLSKKEYLERFKFPDKSSRLGPSIRAGDFGEILVADYLEYFLKKYWVPRTRFKNKTVRDESVKGCDVLGFYFKNPGQTSEEDELILFEAKTQLTSQPHPTTKLQEAITHSAKDITRKAEALNAVKQRFLDRSQTDEAKKVERFQNLLDRPYKEIFGAAAILCNQVFNASLVSSATANEHPKSNNLVIIIISGEDLMPLVHELYRRAADEA